MIGSRINLTTPYMVYQMNSYAARVHRTDFVEQVRRELINFFSEKEHTKVQKEL